MPIKNHDPAPERAPDSDDPLSRFERSVVSRRDLLAGLAVGSIAGTGLVFAATRTAAPRDFQPLAAIAGGAAAPTRTRYFLPAIDSTGRGLIVTVDVEFAEGSGELFVNLNHVEVRHDVQLALREALQTAERLTDRTLADTDVYVTFTRDDPAAKTLALRGKSWEAGVTAAILAGLRRQALTNDVLLTGVVADFGTLLPVGGIEAKARVARAFGATELLVPAGQATTSVPGIRITGVPTISAAFDELVA